MSIENLGFIEKTHQQRKYSIFVQNEKDFSMKKNILTIIIALSLITLTGCPNINPFSPDSDTKIEDVQGDIEGISTTQDSLVLELQTLRKENVVMAQKIESLQDAQGNFISQNSGVKIGDGLIMGAVIVIIFAMFLIYYYRTKAVKQKEASEILVQQIALYDDEYLNDQIFTAAMNTSAETEIYHLMVKNQGKISSMLNKKHS